LGMESFGAASRHGPSVFQAGGDGTAGR